MPLSEPEPAPPSSAGTSATAGGRSTGAAGADPAGRGTLRRITRRIALRSLVTLGAVATTAAGLTPLLRARSGPVRVPAPGSRSPERFAEVYRGRHIEGSATVLVPAGAGAGAGGGPGGPPWPSVEVRIDGRPLRITRRADGSYLSLVNHYESFPTLREVARAAVDELGPAQLVPAPWHGSH
jgi:hypothetical protein